MTLREKVTKAEGIHVIERQFHGAKSKTRDLSHKLTG